MSFKKRDVKTKELVCRGYALRFELARLRERRAELSKRAAKMRDESKRGDVDDDAFERELTELEAAASAYVADARAFKARRDAWEEELKEA